MFWWLLGAHLAGVAAASIVGRRSMRSDLLTAAIAPAATAVWTSSRIAGNDQSEVHELIWVDGLDLTWWDKPIQAALAVSIVASAVAGSFVGSRLGAALTLGAVDIGMSGLFIVHGAPDLALTQLLVETIVVVAFVVGLGHLGQRFPPTNNSWQIIRIAIAVFGGLATTVALASAGSNPTGRTPVEALTEAAVKSGGGNNVVNVVLTDLRALDTLGEVIVLATVSVGILALAKVRRSEVAP